MIILGKVLKADRAETAMKVQAFVIKKTQQ